MPKASQLLEGRFRFLPPAAAILLCAGLGIRLMLLARAWHDVDVDLGLLAAFAWGGLYDLATTMLALIPLVVLLAFVPERLFRSRLFAWLASCAAFALLAALCFLAVAEWTFWDEFGTRFNFIAVDYLVYTTEVVGNIRESYPLAAIFGGIGVTAFLLVLVLCVRGERLAGLQRAGRGQPLGRRLVLAGIWLPLLLLPPLLLEADDLPAFTNNFQRELAKNGVWSFVAAFRHNEIDYEQFYPRIGPAMALKELRSGIVAADAAHPLPSDAAYDLLRLVEHPGPERRLNVIQITVESLSAAFLGTYGNTKGWTPNLDRLAAQSLIFDNFYATGTRTDRGMEALTLAVPPTPGRSLVKRPDNANLFTLGSLFRQRGYDTVFLYGGYGYFDNMSAFFGGNGYRVVDRAAVAASEVTFANAWGASDEDLYRWTLREADRAHAAGQPFFHFVMTTSNHRPYTYPDGRIDLPPKVSGRAGAVKYTDYAIGRLQADAATRPWYRDTVFVVVADHCASSAGRSELEVANYRIPLMIFTPGGQIAPGRVATMASQIDYPPTLLAQLGWTYRSRFFGWNALAIPPEQGRALIGNYQRLGLLRADGRLAILRPASSAATYRVSPGAPLVADRRPDGRLIDAAIAYYQGASMIFDAGGQAEDVPQYSERR